MALIAKFNISTRDKDGNLKIFEAGKAITGLNKTEEKRLIDKGAAEQGIETKNSEEK
ncbi:hypothetical protein ACJ2A9_21315 [Anaerobacillus sp. MEB173]|uniref:hypothetical protein n=1 Tax=Anaerobacillus sp. MEB173 TaxID=3383345 RepID=UPI003F939903